MLSAIANIFTIPLLYPVLLISIGLYCLFSDNIFKAKCFISAGLVLIALVTQPGVATLIIRPLESISAVKQTDTKEASTIIVMACNYRHETGIPFESRWNKCSSDRLLRAIDIHFRTGDNIMVGGGNFGEWPQSYAYYANIFLLKFGVDIKNISVVPQGYDSESEIQAILSNLATQNVTLVTSASHMKRARFFFDMCGKTVIPESTDYLARPSSTLELSLPSSESLAIIKRALHEYLGIAEQAIKRELGLFDEYCHNI